LLRRQLRLEPIEGRAGGEGVGRGELLVTDRECEDPKLGLGVVPVYSPLVFEDTGLKYPGNRWNPNGGFP